MVYQIFAELLARYLIALQPLATEFVTGVIAAMVCSVLPGLAPTLGEGFACSADPSYSADHSSA